MEAATTLHLFIGQHADGYTSDYLIAEDEADAWLVLTSQIGLAKAADYREDGYTIRQHPDEEPFTMTDCDGPGQPSLTYTGRDWAADYGRGYLGGCA